MKRRKKQAKRSAPRAKRRPAKRPAARRARVTKTARRPKRAARAARPAKRAGGGLVYYAPGGGLGHLTRGVAILRRWKTETRWPGLLVTYSPFAPLAAREGIAVKQIAGPDASVLKTLLRRVKPRVFVVDTFPRGILGEIAEIIGAINCPVVLIQRFLNPAYLRQFNVAAFVGQRYQMAVRIADSLPPQTVSPRTVDVPPVTVRSARELPSGPRSGWLFVDWGEGSEPFAVLALEVARRRGKALRIVKPGEAYPAVELMPRAELVIGGGGYNLFHEVALAGTPAIFVPGRRMYDDQFGRTTGAVQARTPEALRIMLEGELPQPLPPHQGDGAAGAVAAIQKLLASTERKATRPPGARR